MSSSLPPEQPHAGLPSGEETKYKGVRRRKWGRWVSEIRLPNSRERIWLGSYDTPEKAARAFDAASVCLRDPGCTEGLNFPGSPPAVGLITSDPDEVRAAAMSHANRIPSSSGGAAAPSESEGAAAAAMPAPAAPLRVSVETFDWSEVMANPPPLFSPTVVMGDHNEHLPAASSVTPATDVDMEETDESVSWPGLWDFDSGDTPRH